MTNKTKVNTRQQILIRARFIFGLVLVFGLSIIYSIFKLQNGYEKEFSTELKKKNTRIKTVNGIRGNIYADDGGLLATSVPTYDLIWDANVPGLQKGEFEIKIDSLSNLFSRHIPSKSPSYWRNKLKSLRSQKVRYYKLAIDINFDLVKSMKTWPLIRKGKFKGGFWFEEKGKRMYFLGELAKRAIGYTRNGVNIGLEGAFDSLLRGTSAQIMEQRMPGNIWRPVSIGNDAVAENGKDIVTTLDVGFQDITQYALNKALVEHQADHGCVIVMDVKTGAIKAIANLKRGNDGKYYESQNYAVDQFSEPGSTFKIISALALLEDKKAVSTDSVPTKNGIIKYYNTPITDGSDHAITKKFYTLEECIEKSSNVGVSQFIFNAYQKNPEEFLEFIFGMGLNIKPNFDIKSSNFPMIHDPKSTDWSGVTLPSMSIGYSLKISPLQTLMIYNAIANKGVLMNPYLVKEIRRDGQQLETIEPKILKKKICSEKTLISLQKMLEGVVSEGTAKTSFKECLYPVAGKTGTARISNESSGYSKKHMSSFVGYFPATNPQYSIIVVINEPNNGSISGAVVAAPVFKEIADKIFSTHIKLQPTVAQKMSFDVPKVLSGELTKTKIVMNELGISSKAGDLTGGYVKPNNQQKSIELSQINIKPNVVPDFRNMGIRDALNLANRLGIEISYSGYGKITAQSFPPGTRFNKSININLTLSKP